MNLHQFLLEGRQEILAQAVESLNRAHLEHYEKAGTDLIRQRLDDLLGLTIDAVRERSLTPVVAHANAVATMRFETGVDLSEVQTAYNVLEEVIWLRILKRMPPVEQGEALGLVGTILGAGKDALARKYLSLATQIHTPSLDLKALFSGNEG
jgi:hypothetical protein